MNPVSHVFYLYQISPSPLERSCVEDHVGHLADTLPVTECCKYQWTAGVNDTVLSYWFESM